MVNGTRSAHAVSLRQYLRWIIEESELEEGIKHSAKYWLGMTRAQISVRLLASSVEASTAGSRTASSAGTGDIASRTADCLPSFQSPVLGLGLGDLIPMPGRFKFVIGQHFLLVIGIGLVQREARHVIADLRLERQRGRKGG